VYVKLRCMGKVFGALVFLAEQFSFWIVMCLSGIIVYRIR
jgi:hypothetical protein